MKVTWIARDLNLHSCLYHMYSMYIHSLSKISRSYVASIHLIHVITGIIWILTWSGLWRNLLHNNRIIIDWVRWLFICDSTNPTIYQVNMVKIQEDWTTGKPVVCRKKSGRNRNCAFRVSFWLGRFVRSPDILYGTNRSRLHESRAHNMTLSRGGCWVQAGCMVNLGALWW